MKFIKYTTILAITIVSLISCGGGAGSQPATADGFDAIEADIKSEFGADAFYTELTITHDKSIGNIIGATVTEKPESLKMGQWSFVNGVWTQSAEVSLEVPEGTKAADYMFQLNDKINLKTLGGLVEKSITDLKAEKELEAPALHIAFIKFPDNGEVSNAEYVVMLQPGTGGTTFTYSYELDGSLIGMDY